MTLSERLARAIREPHDRIERLPIAQAMAAATVEAGPYVALLEQLRRLHLIVEARFAACEALAGLYDHAAMARAGDAAADLCALGATPGQGETCPATRRFASLLGEGNDGAAELAGYLYVLEGSRMGSLFLAGRLAEALGVEPAMGNGLDYHVRDVAGRPMRWRQFKATLDAFAPAAAAPEITEWAAVRAMQLLHDVYQAAGAAHASRAAEPAGVAG